MLYKIITAKW